MTEIAAAKHNQPPIGDRLQRRSSCQREPQQQKHKQKQMKQAELGVPHSKSKLSWPNQKVS